MNSFVINWGVTSVCDDPGVEGPRSTVAVIILALEGDPLACMSLLGMWRPIVSVGTGLRS